MTQKPFQNSIRLFPFVALALFASPAYPQVITTYAGNGICGNNGDGGPATLASFCAPDDIDQDSAGNLYIADANSGVIRRVDKTTGTISTVAGSGLSGYSGDGGPATLATFNYPTGIAFDASDNLYIADFDNCSVRRVDKLTGIITTVIGGGPGKCGFSGDGGPGSLAQLDRPNRITFDALGNLYIADYVNNRIRKWNSTTGIITTAVGIGTMGFSGDGGPANLAEINDPEGLTFDSAGDLYFTDTGNFVVRKVSASTGIITTFAGTPGVTGYSGDGGPATAATFSIEPDDILQGCNGNIFITDDFNNVLRMVDTNGIITTVVGNGIAGYSGDGGPPLAARIHHPEAMTLSSTGDLYLLEYESDVVRKITLACHPTATPTQSLTSTSTQTATATETPTTTPTPTRTPTKTATSTLTITPTISPTFTPSNIPTFTQSPTNTPTPTRSPTPGLTFTATASATPTPTATIERAYKVKAGVYNEAGELVETLFTLHLAQPISSLDLRGNEIRTLNGADHQIDLYSQGVYLGTWNGLTQDGKPVPNGSYHIKIDSEDAYGTVSTVTQTAVVGRPLSHVEVAVYNEAGELVRTLQATTADPTATLLTGMVLGEKVLPLGLPNGQAQSLRIILETSGAPVTLWWDGTNDAGILVRAGHYQIAAHWEDGQGGSTDASQGIMVTTEGKAKEPDLTAQPNLLDQSNGYVAVFSLNAPQGTVLKILLYNSAGELVEKVVGTGGGNTASWDATRYASGLYFAVADLMSKDGKIQGRRILKILVIH